MKKTYNINLGGRVFCIDEDAYLKLQSYIDTLEQHYLKEEDGTEIMADIENRIAELFHESLEAGHREAVILEDADRAIRIMGSPDVIIDEETDDESQPRISRKLYRDTNNHVLGGVAAGIAAYFDLPVVAVRLSFVLLAFLYGFTLWIYIILWIVLPKAVTSRQKMEMKGEKINISNIEKNIKNSYNEVKKNGKLKNILERILGFISEFFQALGKILFKAGKICLGILATFTLFTGCFLLLVVSGAIFSLTNWDQGIYTLALYFMPSPWLWLARFTTFFLINIPIFLLVYFSVIYLFNLRLRRSVILVSGILWLTSCLLAVFLLIHQGLNLRQDYEAKTTEKLLPQGTTPNAFYLKMQHPYVEKSINNSFHNFYIRNSEGEGKQIYCKNEIYFKSTTDSVPQLVIEKYARGFSTDQAAKNSNAIESAFSWKNDTLTLDQYYTLIPQKWAAQRAKFILYIPEGDTLHLTNATPANITNQQVFQAANKKQTNQSFVMQNKRLRKLK